MPPIDAEVGQQLGHELSPVHMSLLPDALPLDTHCFLEVGSNPINKDSKDDTSGKMDVWHNTFMLSAAAYMVHSVSSLSLIPIC